MSVLNKREQAENDKRAAALRDATIARRSAWLLLATLAIMLTFQLLALAINMVLTLILQIPANMKPGPGVTQVDRLAGTLPYPVPAWIGAIVLAGLVAVTVLCWKPSRHLTPVKGDKIYLWTTPGIISFVAFGAAGTAASCSLYYPNPDGSPSGWLAVMAGGLTLGTITLARYIYLLPPLVEARTKKSKKARRA